MKFNTDLFSPIYRPGVSGYGMKGPTGLRGDTGTSIHYASYNLSNEKEMEDCIELISNGKVLSNNKTISSVDDTYMDGDIVFDRNGRLYTLCGVEEGAPVLEYNGSFFSANTIADQLRVLCITDFDHEDSPYYYLQNNPLYKKGIEDIPYKDSVIPDNYWGTSSKNFGFPCYAHLAERTTAGNWLYFSLIPKDGRTFFNLKFEFVLCLRNGRIFSVESSSPVAVMFIDNTELAQCVPIDSINNSNDESWWEKKNSRDTTKEFIEKDGRPGLLMYQNIYVDVKNEQTGKIFRIYLSDTSGSKIEDATEPIVIKSDEQPQDNPHYVESSDGVFAYDESVTAGNMLKIESQYASSYKIVIKTNVVDGKRVSTHYYVSSPNGDGAKTSAAVRASGTLIDPFISLESGELPMKESDKIFITCEIPNPLDVSYVYILPESCGDVHSITNEFEYEITDKVGVRAENIVSQSLITQTTT